MTHLHFVQSLEPLYGAGLGAAALGLHLAMRELPGTGSQLAATRQPGFTADWPGALQYRRVKPDKAFLSPQLWLDAAKLVAESDVIHGHGFYTAVNAALGGQARRRKRPLVLHAHGFLEPWILGRSRKKKALAHALFEDANFKAARLWRAISEVEVAQIKALGFPAPIVLIPNGLDLAALEAERAALPPAPGKTARRLLFLSRLHPKKGLDLLIPAWAAVAARFADWELHLVGPDEDGYAATIRQMIAETGAPRVSILPPVSGAEKAATFRDADAFVLPSHSEGFPMALLEAAAHRLPVIQTANCNFPELTAAGAAWTCEAQVASLTTALEAALAADPAELAQRGELGRALIAERYTWERVAKQLQDACARYF